MQQQPDKLTRTPLKDDIEHSFKETQVRASILRNAINCNCPGNKEAKFREFVGFFDYLFSISRFKKDLDKTVIDKCKKWFRQPNKKANVNTIYTGVDLFEEYSNDLFDKGMIKY